MENTYFKVLLKDITNHGLDSEFVYAICENNNLYELLTNKKIYMDDNQPIDKKSFKGNNYSIVGATKDECYSVEIALYIKFLPKDEKERVISYLNELERYTSDYMLNNSYDDNKVKRLTKSDFIKKY